MTTTQSPSEARSARDAAIFQVESHADETWKEAALQAVRLAALHMAQFTTHEVWPLIVGADTHEARAMGAIMKQAAKLGYIEATNVWLPSSSIVNHARPQRVWKSRIWTGAIQPFLLEV